MNRRPFVRRRPFSSLGLILLIALLGWIWQERVALWAFPDIISAYTAKEYCSCRYVMDNPVDYCLAYVKQYVVDLANHQALAQARTNSKLFHKQLNRAAVGLADEHGPYAPVPAEMLCA